MAHAESLVSLHLVQQDGEPAVAPFLGAIIGDISGSPCDYASFSIPSSAASDVLTLANAVRGIYIDAVAHNVTEAKFTSALQKMGVSPDVVGTVSSTLFSRKEDILARHRQNLVRSYEGSHLVEFDWSVKHVVASDKLVNLADTLVSLSLRLKGNSGASDVATELSSAELDALVLKLENAIGAAAAK